MGFFSNLHDNTYLFFVIYTTYIRIPVFASIFRKKIEREREREKETQRELVICLKLL